MITDKTWAEVRRHFAVPAEKVFAAFASAELVERWLTPAPEIRLTVLQFDFREGGCYRFAYHVPGAATVIVGGSYRLITQPSKLVFSWIIEPPDEHAGIESEVSVTITPDGSGSELVIRHEKFRRADAIERHTVGWRGAIDQLTVLLAEEDQHSDDHELGSSVRSFLKGAGEIREVKMFGGIGFMLNGNLVAAASRRGLLLRVGKQQQAEALSQSGTRPMVMGGRTMEGYVYVDPPELSKQTLQNGLRLAIAYVQTLPPKAERKSKQKRGKRK